MKQVINGRTYDTETADEIGTDSDLSNGRGDFRHYEETLYRTKNGRYFLAGSGGPLSRWAVGSSHGMSGGEGIIAMDHVEALEWCEAAHIDADTIAEYFTVEEA